MITARKARELANGMLRWWEHNQKQRGKQRAFLNCYSEGRVKIDKSIKKASQRQEFKTSVEVYPFLYSLGRKEILRFCSKSERVEVYQTAITKLERELKQKGYEVELVGSKYEGPNPFYADGLVGMKYKFYISWK